MFVDGTKLSGLCECGHEHNIYTRFAVIENGALKAIDKWLEEAQLNGKRCALYEENTYRATEGRHPRAEQEIVLSSEGLHANELATAEVLSRLDADTSLIIAIGCGTIHDIARYCAKERGIDFVSCPTGASVDGFSSSVCSMTWYGYKVTTTAVAPIIMVSDTEIVKNAPAMLMRSGVGDIIAKYTALADWEMAHAVTGEYYCERIAKITRRAADDAMASIEGLLNGEDAAYDKLMYALVMSGFAMQMMGNSRPASGAEHHVSHLIELGPEKLEVAFPALHGEKTGVGTLLATAEYKRLAERLDIAPFARPYKSLEAEELYSFFGDKLAKDVLKENEKDCLSTVTPEQIVAAWPAVRAVIEQIPEPAQLLASLVRLGAKHTLEEIGAAPEQAEEILRYSPMVRNRLTLMRMKRMLEL